MSAGITSFAYFSAKRGGTATAVDETPGVSPFGSAPLFVALITWIVWRERPKPRFLAALAIAFAGVLLIVSPKLGQARGALTGDLLGLGTAAFYGAYMIVVARMATTYGTGALMLRTTLIFTVLLAPLMIGQKILPDTLHGWMLLLGLGCELVQGYLFAPPMRPAEFERWLGNQLAHAVLT